MPNTPAGSIEERFWAKVDKNGIGGCWTWMACINQDGYGNWTIGKKTVRAHRMSWNLLRGDIPDGMFLDHVCRVRSCVNPDHLRVVTPKENAISNSLSRQAINSTKTHCIRGHILAGENLIDHGRGYRNCRTCKNLHGKEYMREYRAGLRKATQ